MMELITRYGDRTSPTNRILNEISTVPTEGREERQVDSVRVHSGCELTRIHVYVLSPN